MISKEQEVQSRAEWQAWQRVCDELVSAGSVTPQDLKRPVSEGNTPGTMLLNCIRAWGEERANLRLLIYMDNK
jgi:hypothetical protein